MVAAITNNKLVAYKALVSAKLGKVLTSSQMKMAMNPTALKMMEYQSALKLGATNTVLNGQFIPWLTARPLAMKFFTELDDVTREDFLIILKQGDTTSTPEIWGAATALVAGTDDVPNTFVTLYNEDVTRGVLLKGLIALRSMNVASTHEDDGANLGAGSAGTAYTDTHVRTNLFNVWGANKFSDIMNKGVLISIAEETDTDYDTINEVAAVYDGWSATDEVPVRTFFQKLGQINTYIYKENLPASDATQASADSHNYVLLSELYAYRNNLQDFNKFTSDAVQNLIAAGGTFAGVVALSAAQFTAMTSANSIAAIKFCSATYTNLTTAYALGTSAYNSLTSDNAISLCKKGYANWAFSDLITGYGSHNLDNQQKFMAIVDPKTHTYISKGVTYANLGTAHDAGLLNVMNHPKVMSQVLAPETEGSVAGGAVVINTVYSNLVGLTSSSAYSGFELLGAPMSVVD